MTDSDNDPIPAYLENKQMLQLEDYLKRGRRLAAVGGDELKSLWVAAFKEFATNLGKPFDARNFEDTSAEFAARREEPPFDLVTSEMAALRAARSPP
jgi:hypothetical protein